jgi:hypothetical protein
MAADTALLDLVTPTQGDLTGTWGNVVNNGITEYVDIAIAGTTTFNGDGAVTLVNTIGNASATNIVSTSAQYAVVRVTGTLTTPKVITFGSAGAAPYSKMYLVDNAATGSTVTFKAYGQTGVSIAAGEACFVYYNGTDIIKVTSDLILGGYTTTATAAGTTTLTAASTTTQFFTGVTTQTVVLPVASTLVLGAAFSIHNNSTGDLTVNSSGSNLVATITPNTTCLITCILTSGTSAASWDADFTGFTSTLPVVRGGTGLASGTSGGVLAYTASGTLASSAALAANNVVVGGGAGAAPSSTNLLAIAAAVTSGNYIRSIGYADTVTALGNTGSAINLDVTSGGVFTATLSASATITVRYPVATGSSSFTLILTNSSSGGPWTVSFVGSGATFKYPGGAASLSRSTAVNAVDVWVFFTPDGGTTWYGNIAMKNMTT